MRNALATGSRAIDLESLRALAEMERQASIRPPAGERLNYLAGDSRMALPSPPSNSLHSRQTMNPRPWDIEERGAWMPSGDTFPDIRGNDRYREPSKFRNTLGHIADAFAIAGGRKPVYEPIQQERRYKNALASFATSNIDDPIAFGALVAEGGDAGANMAFKMRDDRRDAAKSAVDLDSSRMKLMRDANRGAIELLSGVTDQASWDEALGRADSLYRQFGADVRSHLPEVFPGPDGLRRILMDAMDVDDRLAAMDRRDRLEWDMEDDRIDNDRADRNTSSLITKRAQPPAPRRAAAPRAPTTSGIVAGVLAKVRDGVKLTPGETEIYTRYRDGTGGRGGRRADTGAAPATGPQQYKEGDIVRNPQTGKSVILRNGRWVPNR